MKICVKEIMRDGLDLEEEVSSQELVLDKLHDETISDIRVKAHIEKDKDVVIASCDIRANERLACSRCLEEFDLIFEKKEDFVYNLSGEHIIELNDDIKDTILLDYPIMPLCKPDCKGLCHYCGKNLNEGSCDCEKERDKACRE